MIAQQLYEGLDVEAQGQVGLITYTRTDSSRISETAQDMTKAYILKEFGKEYLGSTKKKTTAKNDTKIQDAHEAIRPTDINLTPDNIASSLNKDQLKLYTLH